MFRIEAEAPLDGPKIKFPKSSEGLKNKKKTWAEGRAAKEKGKDPFSQGGSE